MPWAQALLSRILPTNDLTRDDKAKLFELRFAYALHQAEVAARYEVPGEGKSTLDFGFESAGRKWRVELMRLEETDAARHATHTGVDEDGTQWFGRILRTDAEDQAQSEEGETLKAVERICQKCATNDGQPYKFPVAGDAYQALFVDFRTFGGDDFDRLHVGLGGHVLRNPFHRRYWNGQLITGVFHPDTALRRASLIRERVHFLGFVNEGSYEPGAFGESIQFIANPNPFASAAAAREALATWPLQPAKLLNG